MDPFLILAVAMAVAAATMAALLLRRRAIAAEAEAVRLRHELVGQWVAARKDPVTGLLNRKGFEELGGMLATDATNSPLVMILVDIGDPTPASELFHQGTVDGILRAVGRRFADYAIGPIVARLDGGKFGALLRSSVSPDGSHFPDIDELTRRLAEPLWAAGKLRKVPTKVGSSSVDDKGDLAMALSKAEAAMRRRTPAFDEAKEAEHIPPKPRNVLAPIYYHSRVMAMHQVRSLQTGRNSTTTATNTD